MTLFRRRPPSAPGNHADPVADAAAMWLARHQLGSMDAEAFERWRGESPSHAIAFARALATWERFDPLTDAPAMAQQPSMLSRRDMLRAASVVLAVGVAGGGLVAGKAYAWSTATTAVGENRTVRLPDGSTASLNTDSRLSWRFSSTERSLWVERGEVGLRLGEGPSPILRGEHRQILLSAGRFNIRLRNDAIDMLVLDGQARIDHRLVEGGRAAQGGDTTPSLLVSRDAEVVRPATADQVAGMLAWQHGEILFQDATLGTAVEEYNRFLTRKIVIVDRELAEIPVGGRFTSTDPADFLQALSAGLGIRISQSSQSYLLTR